MSTATDRAILRSNASTSELTGKEKPKQQTNNKLKSNNFKNPTTMEEEKTTMTREPNMSPEIGELAAALADFQSELEQPALNKSNPYFKSRYIDLSGCLKAVMPLLSKNGLSVCQLVEGGDLVTNLLHKSGQWLKSRMALGSYKNQQERGSAITYCKRYALCAMLGLAADTDDDGNAATDADRKKSAKPRANTLSQRLTQLAEDPDTAPEVIPILQAIITAESMTALSEIYKANKELQQSPLFLEFLTTKKKELTA